MYIYDKGGNAEPFNIVEILYEFPPTPLRLFDRAEETLEIEEELRAMLY